MSSEKVVLIAGGTSRLGRHIAERLAHEHHRVYAGVHREEDVSALRTLWRPLADRVRAIALDVTKDADCLRAVQEVVRERGRLDILINTAGLSPADQVTQTDSAAFLHLLDVNVVGALRCMRAALPAMEPGGRIITITSVSGLVDGPYSGPYVASKHALHALGTALSYETRKRRIWVVNVAPGLIDRTTQPTTSPGPRQSPRPLRERSRVLRTLLPPLTDESVARTIAALATSAGRPPRTVVLGRDAKLLTVAHRFLPRHVWEALFQYSWDTTVE